VLRSSILLKGKRGAIQGKVLITQILLDAVAVTLILVGLAGAMVPALPGIPLIFGGIWLIAYSTTTTTSDCGGSSLSPPSAR